MMPYLRCWMIAAALMSILVETDCIEARRSLAQDAAPSQNVTPSQAPASNQEQVRNVTIAEEPKYIDPIGWVPESLRAKGARYCDPTETVAAMAGAAAPFGRKETPAAAR